MDKCPYTNDDPEINNFRNTITNNYDFSGWLKKQGSKIKAYKKRFFVLHNYSLSYYSNEDLNKLIGKISIKNTILIADSEQNLDSTGFTLRPNNDFQNNKHIHLLAKSSEECNAWIKAIQKNLFLRHGGALFGTDLTAQFCYCSSEFGYLPRVVHDCMRYILENGIKSEGIFRKCAQKNELIRLADYYNQCQFMEAYEQLNPNLAAGLLKFYLRELPEPLVPYTHYDDLKASGYRINAKEDLTPVIDALNRLPIANYILLKELCIFLKNVARHEKENLMSIKSLASVFSPNVLRQEEEDPKIEISASPLINITLGAWIEFHEDIFLQDTPTLFDSFLRSVTLNEANGSFGSGSNISIQSRSNSPSNIEYGQSPSNSPQFFYSNSPKTKSVDHSGIFPNGIDIWDHDHPYSITTTTNNNQTSPILGNIPIRRAWQSLLGVSHSNRSNNTVSNTPNSLAIHPHRRSLKTFVHRPNRPLSPSKTSVTIPIEDHIRGDFVMSQPRPSLHHKTSMEINNNNNNHVNCNPQVSWQLRKHNSLMNRQKDTNDFNKAIEKTELDHQSKNSSINTNQSAVSGPPQSQEITKTDRNYSPNALPSKSSPHHNHTKSIPDSNQSISSRRLYSSFSIDQKQFNRQVTLDELLDLNFALPNMPLSSNKENMSKSDHFERSLPVHQSQRTEDSLNSLNQSLFIARIELAREKANSDRLSNQLSDMQGNLNLANLEIHFLQNRVKELEEKLKANHLTPDSSPEHKQVTAATTTPSKQHPHLTT